MPKKWIDKKNATSFTLVHRAPDDEEYFHEDSGVLVPTEDPNSREAKQARKDKWRNPHAGDAAKYGILFDDTSYDYTQHLATIGEDPEAVFLPAQTGQRPDQIDYTKFQSVPDEIAGFQPDMDPRLREVLEALDDDAYVSEGEDGEDIFAELVKDGEVQDQRKWKKMQPQEELKRRDDEEDWEFEFRKFKLDNHASSGDEDDDEAAGSDISSNFGGGVASDAGVDLDEARDTLGALPDQQRAQPRKHKKRIGAKTDLSGYSMSSSANYRNAGLTLLDDRFDKIEEEYEQPSEEEGDEEFDMAKERPDFEGILDDFLASNKPQKLR